MKLIYVLLLLSPFVRAQSITQLIRRDSVPSVFPPDIMPNARPNNSFYRYPSDPGYVMRATLDNMPVKVPDSSAWYTMLRSYQNYEQPKVTKPLLKPMPRIIPRRFR